MVRTAVLTPSFVVALAAAAFSGEPAGTPTYERDVRPILKAHCFQCHGEAEKLAGRLDLRLRRLMVKGGKRGRRGGLRRR